MVVLGRRRRAKRRGSRAPLKEAGRARARAGGEHRRNGWHAQVAKTRVVLVALFPWWGTAFLAGAGAGAAVDGRDDEGREGGGTEDGHDLVVAQQGLNLLPDWVGKAVVAVLLVRRCAALVDGRGGGRGMYMCEPCVSSPLGSLSCI